VDLGLGNGLFNATIISFSGDTFSFVDNEYTDSTCLNVDFTFSTGSGFFSIGNTITASSGLGAKEIDFTLNERDGVLIFVGEQNFDIFRISSGTLYFGLDDFGLFDGTTPANRPIDLDFNSPVDPLVDPLLNSELEGSWKTSCVDFGGTFDATIILFSGDTFSFVDNAYTDSACLNVDVTYRSGSGVFSIGNTITASSGLGAKEIDFTFTHRDGVVLPVNEQSFDIFSISSGTLYFGLYDFVLDGTTPASRLIDLDFTSPIERN